MLLTQGLYTYLLLAAWRVCVCVLHTTGVIFLASWVVYAAVWTNRLRLHVLRSPSRGVKIARGVKRLTRFLLAEMLLFVVLIAMSGASLWAQEKGRITLNTDSELVLAIKVVQRATQFMLMAILVSTVTVVRRKQRSEQQSSEAHGGANGKNAAAAGKAAGPADSGRSLIIRTFRHGESVCLDDLGHRRAGTLLTTM